MRLHVDDSKLFFSKDTEQSKPDKPRKSSKKPASKSRKAPKVIAQEDVSNINNDDL